MIDYEAIEDALFDAVKASTAYEDADIIFGDQNGVSPSPTPYAAIRVGDLTGIGQDASRNNYDAARPAGQEIHRVTSGMRYLAVRFAFFSPMSDEDPTGRVARSAAAKMQADLALESIRTPLRLAGLGLLKKGDVRWLPQINNTDFEARAIIETQFSVSSGAVDATGYIARVNGTMNVKTGGATAVIPFTAPKP